MFIIINMFIMLIVIFHVCTDVVDTHISDTHKVDKEQDMGEKKV